MTQKKVRKSALEKMVEEAKRIEEKEKILADMQRLYSRFGEQVITIIMDYAFKAQGLAVLLRKLDVLPPITREEQQQALLDYLNRLGPEQFLRVLRESHTMRFAGPSVSVAGSSVPARTGREAQTAATALPTEAQAQPASVERRSGNDRRKGAKRRQQVELIFKNRRFGGERRSGRDRRKKRHPMA